MALVSDPAVGAVQVTLTPCGVPVCANSGLAQSRSAKQRSRFLIMNPPFVNSPSSLDRDRRVSEDVARLAAAVLPAPLGDRRKGNHSHSGGDAKTSPCLAVVFIAWFRTVQVPAVVEPGSVDASRGDRRAFHEQKPFVVLCPLERPCLRRSGDEKYSEKRDRKSTRL